MSVFTRPSLSTSSKPKESESISHRLARLRIEDNKKGKPKGPPRFSTRPSPPLPSVPHNFNFDFIPSPQGGWEGEGPAAPPSWTFGRGVDNKKLLKKNGKEKELFLKSSEEVFGRDPVLPQRGNGGLWEICGRKIIKDVSNPDDSVLLGYLKLLPVEERIKMVALAPVLDEGNGLNEESLRELLLESDDWDDDEDQVEYESGSEESWEKRFLRDDFASTAPAERLVRLDLSFSEITLKELRSLLSTPSSISTSDKPILNFPNLTTLLLTSTSQIPLNSNFFDLITTLLPLRHLSLVGKRLQFHQTTNMEAISKLITSTPSLISIDMSYCGMGVELLLGYVINWRNKWKELRVMGLKEDFMFHEGIGMEEEMNETREQEKKQVEKKVMNCREESGHFVDFTFVN